jgi:hypothetical protein
MSVIREVCRIIDVRYEMMITGVFAIISGSYLIYKYGLNELIDILMKWMFPASMMILITLIIMLMLERASISK